VFVEISLSAHIISNDGAALSMETIDLFVNCRCSSQDLKELCCSTWVSTVELATEKWFIYLVQFNMGSNSLISY
jgi:hypothetical protein